MTLTMIDHDDEPFAQFGLDALDQAIYDRVQVHVRYLFHAVPLDSEWYTPELTRALSATRSLLVGNNVSKIEYVTKRLNMVTQDELAHHVGMHHFSLDGVATVTIKLPRYEENPEEKALLAQLDQLSSFLEQGHAAGARLKNSDYDASQLREEEKAVEPVVAAVAEEEAPVQSEPTVEEGIPEEALAPMSGEV